jgi:hypothetical protein
VARACNGIRVTPRTDSHYTSEGSATEGPMAPPIASHEDRAQPCAGGRNGIPPTDHPPREKGRATRNAEFPAERRMPSEHALAVERTPHETQAHEVPSNGTAGRERSGACGRAHGHKCPTPEMRGQRCLRLPAESAVTDERISGHLARPRMAGINLERAHGRGNVADRPVPEAAAGRRVGVETRHGTRARALRHVRPTPAAASGRRRSSRTLTSRRSRDAWPRSRYC